MRTDVEKTYEWGFVLAEQDLRRIAQTCHEHAEKVGAVGEHRVEAKLLDGAVIEGKAVDDVLSLENGGQRSVTRLSLVHADSAERPRALVAVTFENGFLNPKNWQSIKTRVVGESRDAVFVAASDLDERVKKTRGRAWPYVVTRPWFFVVPLAIAMFLFASLEPLIGDRYSTLDAVEAEYRAGRLANPIEAMLYYERLKLATSTGRAVLASVASFGIPMLVFGVAQWFLPKWSLSYVFYWGDAIAVFDKRRNAIRIFWTVVVLGLVVSILATLIVEYFKRSA